MASDDNNNAMPAPPPRPPDPPGLSDVGGEFIRTWSGRQNWPVAASMPAEARASAISSLSTVDGVPPSAAATQIRTINPMDGFDSSESEDDGGGATTAVNSPDKEYNFMGRKSDDDSVASGDDSIAWERETMKIMATFADATALEEGKMEAAAQEDAAPVREIGKYDFEFLADGGFDAENPAPPPEQQYKSRRVEFKASNLKLLKAIALVLSVSGTGTKRVIFNRCRDSPTGVEKISDDVFEYRHPVEVDADGVRQRMETWVVLDPQGGPSRSWNRHGNQRIAWVLRADQQGECRWGNEV
jgi:hypothetical protein